MPRLKAVKRSELESFWRAHLDGWRRSDLNQREYCEAHGLPLKRFGNWRAQFKHEDPAPAGKLLYRRGGKPNHMINHMTMGTTSNYTAVIARLLRFGGNGELHFNYDPDIGEVPELPGGSTVTLVE